MTVRRLLAVIAVVVTIVVVVTHRRGPTRRTPAPPSMALASAAKSSGAAAIPGTTTAVSAPPARLSPAQVVLPSTAPTVAAVPAPVPVSSASAAASAVGTSFTVAYLTVTPSEPPGATADRVAPWATAELTDRIRRASTPAPTAPSTLMSVNAALDSVVVVAQPSSTEFDLSVDAEVTATSWAGTVTRAEEGIEVVVDDLAGGWKVSAVSPPPAGSPPT